MTPILSRLLSGVEKLSNFRKNLNNANPALNLIENILKMLYQNDQKTTQEDVETLKQSVLQFNDFYVNLCKLMIGTDEADYNEKFKLRYDTFKKASSILNQIQKYSTPCVTMPTWLLMVIDCSKSKRAKVVLVSIETFLYILEQECKPGDPNK